MHSSDYFQVVEHLLKTVYADAGLTLEDVKSLPQEYFNRMYGPEVLYMTTMQIITRLFDAALLEHQQSLEDDYVTLPHLYGSDGFNGEKASFFFYPAHKAIQDLIDSKIWEYRIVSLEDINCQDKVKATGVELSEHLFWSEANVKVSVKKEFFRSLANTLFTVLSSYSLTVDDSKEFRIWKETMNFLYDIKQVNNLSLPKFI